MPLWVTYLPGMLGAVYGMSALGPIRDLLGLSRIEAKLDIIKGYLEVFMSVTQKQLDDLAVSLTDSNERIGREIQRLRDENPNLDLTGLTNAVASAAELVPSAVTPGVPPVAADPATPVVPDPSSEDQGGDSVEMPADGTTPTL